MTLVDQASLGLFGTQHDLSHHSLILGATKKNIDFVRIMQPFVQSVAAVSAFVWSAIDLTFLTLNAIEIILFRIIFPPLFNPYSDVFMEKVRDCEAKVPLLRERILRLEQRFVIDKTISKDIRELYDLKSEIAETLKQVQFYIAGLEKRHTRLPIQDTLDQLNGMYEGLGAKIDSYCTNNMITILERYTAVIDTFTKGRIDILDYFPEVFQKLSDDWTAFEGFIRPAMDALEGPAKDEAHEAFDNLRRKALDIFKRNSQNVPTGLIHPLQLRNIGNNCYLNSALQALFCVPQLLQQMRQEIQLEKPPFVLLTGKTLEESKKRHAELILEKEREFKKKLEIQEQLLQFFDVQKMNLGEGRYSQMELILFWLGKPSDERLRSAIFDSGLRWEFRSETLREMLDAASIPELFNEHFLPQCRFKIQKFRATPMLPGLQFNFRPESFATFQIPLAEDVQSLEDLIQAEMDNPKKDSEDHYRYIPQDNDTCQVIDRELAAPFMNSAPIVVKDNYVEWTRFTEMPDVLTLHLKRFEKTNPDPKDKGTKKNANPVLFPSDGIIDLGRYYAVPSSTDTLPQNIPYKIKSYIIHGGDLHGGHYVAHVEINEKYYYCSDSQVKEITKEQFFGCKDAYLIVLEKINQPSADSPLIAKLSKASAA